MSTALDKSLDEIIANGRGPRRAKGNKAKKQAGKLRGSGTTKTAGISKKQQQQISKKAVAQLSQKAASYDASYATKVIVTGLPKDLTKHMIQEFFDSQVGGVKQILMTFNEKGKFVGNATIHFHKNKQAVLAVEKYNNAPIDGGSSKLKLELVIDPSMRPLATRITANAPQPTAAEVQAKAQTKKLKNLRKKAQKKKKTKAAPATAEELDKDMDAYMAESN